MFLNEYFTYSYKNRDSSNLDLAEQLYLGMKRRFHLTKVVKLRYEVSKQKYESEKRNLYYEMYKIPVVLHNTNNNTELKLFNIC